MPGPRDLPPPDPDRVPSILCALAELAVAALLVRAVGAFAQEHSLIHNPLVYGRSGFMQLNPGEARLFLAYAIAGLPAALLLTDAATRLLGGRPAPWSGRVLAQPRLMAVVFALLAAVAVELLRHFVLGGTTMSDDERVYFFQARQLLAGHFTGPRPIFGPDVFQFEFLFPVPHSHDWTGAYPPGQPLFIAFGLLLHQPHLLQTVCAAGIVYITARFADDLWGAETSVTAAALVATSPLLLFNAASLHNAVPATFLLLLATRVAWKALRRGWRRDYALVGGAVGAALLFRPFDAVALGLPIGVALLMAALRPAKSNSHVVGTSGLAIAAASALPFVIFFLAANHAATGNPLEPAYTLWLQRRFPGARTFGFGPTAFPDPNQPEHTPQVMLSKGLVVLCRLSTWLFGWPWSFWPLLAMLLGIGRDRASRFLLALLGAHFVAYGFYTLNAIQDMGSPYHLPEAPIIALLSARAIVKLGEYLLTFGEWLSLWPGRLALTCGLVGVLSFWPIEVQWLHRTAATIRKPIELAEKAANGQPALVFWDRMQPEYLTSWVFFPPAPGPKYDDQLIWVHHSDHDAQVIAAAPNRKPLQLEWDEHGHPQVVPYHGQK